MAFAWTGVKSLQPARVTPSCSLGGRSFKDASGSTGSWSPVPSVTSEFCIGCQFISLHLVIQT